MSKKEFRKAMKMLGCESPRVPKEDVNAVFDEMDPDGGEGRHPTPTPTPNTRTPTLALT